MLRAKVEESRRGVMRLQAESRRMSTQLQSGKPSGPLPLDLTSPTGSRSPGFTSGFPTSKRSSFQLPQGNHFSIGSRPGTNGGHRRISSMSDPGSADGPQRQDSTGLPQITGIDGLPPSPVTHTFSEPQAISGRTNRQSLMTGWRDTSPPSPSALATYAELDSLRSELVVMKKELDAVKRDLAESDDAREAADACAKALREFIAEHGIGERPSPQATRPTSSSSSAGSGALAQSPRRSLQGIRLPPLPTDESTLR